MKIINKETLAKLAQKMPVLSEKEQCTFVAGGNGSSRDPYSLHEYIKLKENGLWNGGYVQMDEYDTTNSSKQYIGGIDNHTSNKKDENTAFGGIAFYSAVSTTTEIPSPPTSGDIPGSGDIPLDDLTGWYNNSGNLDLDEQLEGSGNLDPSGWLDDSYDEDTPLTPEEAAEYDRYKELADAGQWEGGYVNGVYYPPSDTDTSHDINLPPVDIVGQGGGINTGHNSEGGYSGSWNTGITGDNHNSNPGSDSTGDNGNTQEDQHLSFLNLSDLGKKFIDITGHICSALSVPFEVKTQAFKYIEKVDPLIDNNTKLFFGITKKIGKYLGRYGVFCSIATLGNDVSWKNGLKAGVDVVLLCATLTPTGRIVLTIADAVGGTEWVTDKLGNLIEESF